MSAQVESRLEFMSADYESVTGSSFQHFFCPILYRDEDTEECRAHVVNRAFRESDRSWTVQRADVDSWYGTMFEDDFLAIERRNYPIAEDALTDRDLARRFRPRLTVDGDVVPHYVPHGPVPESHTSVEVEIQGRPVQLGLKLSPNEFLASFSGKWEFQVEKDLRLPTVASVIKAAHLTMFHLLGYRYALSAGGFFLGKTVLGDIFLKTRGGRPTQHARGG